MRRIVIAAAAGTLLLPAAAQAHVSLHPNTVPASANPTWNVRVPNEETAATVTKVDMQVPPGFLDVVTELPPGWKSQVLKHKLAVPLKTSSGTVTEEVSEIIWTANGKTAGIPVGSFQQFPILTAVPDGDAGQTLTFKTIESYSNGDVVRWIGPPSADKPAPTVNITAAGGLLQDAAGTEAGPGPVPAAPAAKGSGAPAPKAHATSNGASKGLGIAALIIGILALLTGLGALAATRRPKPAGA